MPHLLEVFTAVSDSPRLGSCAGVAYRSMRNEPPQSVPASQSDNPQDQKFRRQRPEIIYFCLYLEAPLAMACDLRCIPLNAQSRRAQMDLSQTKDAGSGIGD